MFLTDNVCPTCKSKDLDQNEVTIDKKVYKCNCKRQKELYRYYKRANIPREFFYLDWDDCTEYEDKRALLRVKNYAKNLDSAFKRNIGLYLFGSYGLGKTLLGILILKEAIKRGYKKVHLSSLSDIISIFTSGWYNDADRKLYYEKMLNTDFLMIDDIGKEYRSKTGNLAESNFDRVLRYRDHPIIITGNKDLDDIGTMYSDSIVSLIYGKLVRVKFTGSDYRKKVLSKELEKKLEKNPGLLVIK